MNLFKPLNQLIQRSNIFHLDDNGAQIIHDFDPIQDSLQLDSSQSKEDIAMNKNGEILHNDEFIANMIQHDQWALLIKSCRQFMLPQSQCDGWY